MLNKLCSGKQLNSKCEHFVLLLKGHRHQTHNSKQSIVIFIWSQALILCKSKQLTARAILKRTVKVWVKIPHIFKLKSQTNVVFINNVVCINNLAPTDFVNLGTLTARNVEFAQTTLSTGKKLLMIGENGIYQNAVDACNQFGGEVLLTVSDQENRETADFITTNRNILGGEKIVWLRAKNPSSPDETPGSEWIDPLNNQVIPYHHIVQYEHQPAAFLRKFYVINI